MLRQLLVRYRCSVFFRGNQWKTRRLAGIIQGHNRTETISSRIQRPPTQIQTSNLEMSTPRQPRRRVLRQLFAAEGFNQGDKEMSIYAFVFFLFSIVCGVLSVGVDLSDAWEIAAKSGAVLFGTLFAASLLVGRRIKFDPVLR